jgi:hypothetical protein
VRWRWLVALAPFALLATWHGRLGPPLEAGDYAQYLLHARAVLEGRSYTDIGFLYTPFNAYIGPEAEPPGLPLALVPVLATVGPRPWVLSLVMAASGLAFLLLVGRFFADRHGVPLAVASVFMAGVALQLSHAGTSAAADLPFCACLWMVFSLAGRSSRPSSVGGIVLWGALAILFRVAGVALVPAMMLFWLLRTAERTRLLVAIAWAIVFVAMVVALPITSAVGSQFSLDPATMLEHVAINMYIYRLGLAESHLYPFPGDLPNDAYHVVSFLLLAAGAAVWLRREWRSFLACFVVAYLGMLIVTPTRAPRYLWPLYPLFALWMLLGLEAVLRRLRPGWPRALREHWALGAAVVLSLSAAVGHVRRPHPPGLEARADAQALFGHLTTLDPPVRATFFKPRILTWKTRIPAMGTFVAEPEDIWGELERHQITHVVVGDLGISPENNAALRRALAAAPAGRVAWDYGNESFEVFRVAEALRNPSEDGSVR